MKEKTIRTPLDPDITFSDDPLRMMRCIRFATQLGFYIDDDTFESLCRNKERIEIISRERIADELNKIILSPIPSKGFIDLERSGLLSLIFPEFAALQGVETRNGRSHKDNFYHTLEVLDNISKKTDNLWLVGAGPGDIGLFTLKGAAVLQQADVVVYDSLVGEGEYRTGNRVNAVATFRSSTL